VQNLRILSIGRNQIKRFEKLEDWAGTLEEIWASYNVIEKL
jgi:dynein light chain 1